MRSPKATPSRVEPKCARVVLGPSHPPLTVKEHGRPGSTLRSCPARGSSRGTSEQPGSSPLQTPVLMREAGCPRVVQESQGLIGTPGRPRACRFAVGLPRRGGLWSAQAWAAPTGPPRRGRPTPGRQRIHREASRPAAAYGSGRPEPPVPSRGCPGRTSRARPGRTPFPLRPASPAATARGKPLRWSRPQPQPRQCRHQGCREGSRPDERPRLPGRAVRYPPPLHHPDDRSPRGRSGV